MKILLSYKFHKNITPLGFECERALRALGHTALRLNVDPRPHWWRRNHENRKPDRNELLLDCLRRLKPDLLFVLIGYNYAPEVLEEIKRTYGVTTVAWWVENPDNFRVLIPSLPWYDHVFSFSRAVAESLSREASRPCHFVHYGTDPGLYHPLSLGPWGRFRYGCDLSFLGKFKERRREYLSALAGMDLGIWGPLWKKELKKDKHALLTRVRGTRLFDRKAAMLFNATRVNLNINSWATPSGPNLRVFDVLACRACLLTEYVEELEELFVVGRELDTFRSAAELVDKARFYLGHETARERMAVRGYEKVAAGYKMVDSLRRILDSAL